MKLDRFALFLSKTMEVLHWLAAASMAVLLVCSLTMRDRLGALLSRGVPSFGTTLTTCGFEVEVVNAGAVNMTAVALFAVTALLLLPLMAMVFRNVYLILKTAKGKTWFAEGGTPFQAPVIRMLREIGIFLIAVPAVGLLMSVIARAIIGVETAELSVRFDSLALGVLVLCLTQAFTYGQTLQNDVDGLL